MTMNETDNTIFHRDGDRYLPTARASSPWDSRLLHGGSMAGLLAYVLEAHGDGQMQFVRITNDLFRPGPLAPIEARVRTVRHGRQVHALEATLSADGVDFARAAALQLRPTPIDLPAHAQPSSEHPPGPQDLPTVGFLGKRDPSKPPPPGLNAAMEMRLVSGFQFKGEGCAWMRLAAPFMDGEPASPLVHMGVLSDMGNGLGQIYLGGQAACINADISLNLLRLPRSEWVCLESVTQLGHHGLGTVCTRFYDTEGPIGQVMQSQVARLLAPARRPEAG